MVSSNPSIVARVLHSMPMKSLFQRIPFAALCILSFLMVMGPAHHPLLFSAYIFIVHVFFFASLVRAIYSALYCAYRVRADHNVDWRAFSASSTSESDSPIDSKEDSVDFDKIVHIIIIPNYKEDMDTLQETLDVLGSHQIASNQYRVGFLILFMDLTSYKLITEI